MSLQYPFVYRMVITAPTASTPLPRPGRQPSARLTNSLPPRLGCPGVWTAFVAPSQTTMADPLYVRPPSSTGTRWRRPWMRRRWSSCWWTPAWRLSSQASSSLWTQHTGRSATMGFSNLATTFSIGNYLQSFWETRQELKTKLDWGSIRSSPRNGIGPISNKNMGFRSQ